MDKHKVRTTERRPSSTARRLQAWRGTASPPRSCGQNGGDATVTIFAQSPLTETLKTKTQTKQSKKNSAPHQHDVRNDALAVDLPRRLNAIPENAVQLAHDVTKDREEGVPRLDACPSSK
jgi:hypothetical protein